MSAPAVLEPPNLVSDTKVIGLPAVTQTHRMPPAWKSRSRSRLSSSALLNVTAGAGSVVPTYVIEGAA